MPSVLPGSRVLVTGASGFIATWVVKTLLEQGFLVRGTVRSETNGDYLRKLFAEYGEKFDYVIVDDISKDNAFDDAVKEVDAVEHIASPASPNLKEPRDFIDPAVKGTVGLLESVLKYGSKIRRIVITSSAATLLQFSNLPHLHTEEDWNQFSVAEVKQKGNATNRVHWYYASKVLAERAAWDFVQTHEKDISWDITVINPPLVWGPPIHHVQSSSSLNVSLVDFYLTIKGKPPSSIAPGQNWVDVRDVAEGHVGALRVEEAGGERLIVAAGPCTWQSVLDAIHLSEPLTRVPKATSGLNEDTIYLRTFSNMKVRRILGMQFRPLEVCARDTAQRLLDLEDGDWCTK